MSKNLVYIGVVVLAVIAVVLGYQIYQQQTGVVTTPSTQQPQTRDITQPTENQQTTTQRAELTAEEKQALNFPSDNASAEEKKEWTDLLIGLAKTSDILEVSNCIPSPVVLQVKKGATINVKNGGQTDVILYAVGNDQKVSAGGTATLKTNAENSGFFGYRCRLGGAKETPIVGILNIRD